MNASSSRGWKMAMNHHPTGTGTGRRGVTGHQGQASGLDGGGVPDVHRILTVECGWTAEQYEQWLVRSLRALLRPELAEQIG